MAKTLAIVGGGPKAAALVARAAILRELGVKTVPTIYVFEKKDIGSAWSGNDGHSSGYLTPCSPAEKDVGSAYAENELPDAGPSSTAGTVTMPRLPSRQPPSSHFARRGDRHHQAEPRAWRPSGETPPVAP